MIPISEDQSGVRTLQDGPEPDSNRAALGDRETGSGLPEDAGREEEDRAEEEVGSDGWWDALHLDDPYNLRMFQRAMENRAKTESLYERTARRLLNSMAKVLRVSV